MENEKKVTAHEETEICASYLSEVLASTKRLINNGLASSSVIPDERSLPIIFSGLVNCAYMQMVWSHRNVLLVQGIHQTIIDEGERMVYGFDDSLKRHASFLKRICDDGSINMLASKIGGSKQSSIAAAYRMGAAFGIGEMLSQNGGAGENLADNAELKSAMISARDGLLNALEKIYGGCDRPGGAGCLSAIAVMGGLVATYLFTIA